MKEQLVRAWGQNFFEVSKVNFFDDVWVFDEENLTIKILWGNLHYDNGGGNQNSLVDPINSDILAWVKPLFWAMLYHPVHKARPKKPAALAHDFTALRTLLSWMSVRKLRYPCQLTRSEIDTYVDELPDLLLADALAEYEDGFAEENEEVVNPEGEGLGFGWSSFYKRLNLLDIIYHHSERFILSGIEPMPERPFPNIGVRTLASRLATKLPGSIPPLQDEIAVPLFNNAASFVAEALPVIQRLVLYDVDGASYETLLSEREAWSDLACGEVLEEMLRFEAGRVDWHPMPTGLSFLEKWERPIVRMNVTRAFVRHYISACAILVQGLLGMRASEFLSIPRGLDSATGLPVSVRYEISSDSLFKVFLLDASLTKTAAGSESATWTIGAIPTESDELPMAVVAIIHLNKIAALMSFRRDDPGRLFFVFGNNGRNVRTRWRAKSQYTAAGFTRYIKGCIRFFVDFNSLPDESRSPLFEKDLVRWKESFGEVFRPHMMRKTFAQFMYHCDPDLIRGIQLQLQHQSLAMTYGYVSSGQQYSIQTAGEQVLAATITDIMHGEKSAGRQGRRLRDHIGEYRNFLDGANPAQAWVKIQKYNIENNIRLFSNGNHGYCLPLETSQMRCHKIAETTSLAVLRPNLAHRSPDVCSGCSCFLLMPNKSDFWIRRYRENKKAALQLATKPSGSKQGQASLARNIFEQRAKASALLLDQLGIDVRNLPEEVRNDEKP